MMEWFLVQNQNNNNLCPDIEHMIEVRCYRFSLKSLLNDPGNKM